MANSMPDDRKTTYTGDIRLTEWLQYGDPRCRRGRFRPKVNLKCYLDQEGVTLQEFANNILAGEHDLNATSSYVSRMLSGQVYMPDSVLVRACGYYGLRLDYALDLTDFNGAWESLPGHTSSYSDGIRWDEVREVPQEDWEILKKLYAAPWTAMTIEDIVHGIRGLYPYQQEELCDPNLPKLDDETIIRLHGWIDRIYPGDYRDMFHLAHAMVDYAQERRNYSEYHGPRGRAQCAWMDAFSGLAWRIPMIGGHDVYGGEATADSIPTLSEDEERFRQAYDSDDGIEYDMARIQYEMNIWRRSERKRKKAERREQYEREAEMRQLAAGQAWNETEVRERMRRLDIEAKLSGEPEDVESPST